METNSNEPKSSNRFKEELSKSSKKYDWENMPRNDAIITMLQTLGMNPALANNQESRKEIIDLVNKKIGKNTSITENMEAYLKKFIGDKGTIILDEDILTGIRGWETRQGYHEILKHTESTIIDINSEGQLVKTNITNLSEKDTLNTEYNNIRESTHSYVQEVTIDNGIEMKRIDTSSSYDKFTGNSDTQKVTLIRDLNSLGRAYGTIESRNGLNDNKNNRHISLTNLYAAEKILGNHLETDIEKLDAAYPDMENLIGFGYCGTDKVKQQQQEDEFKKIQEDLIAEIPAFKRLAEKLGIVKSTDSIEQ